MMPMPGGGFWWGSWWLHVRVCTSNTPSCYTLVVISRDHNSQEEGNKEFLSSIRMQSETRWLLVLAALLAALILVWFDTGELLLKLAVAGAQSTAHKHPGACDVIDWRNEHKEMIIRESWCCRLQAGKTVAGIVRTTLGPRAMLKMLLGP